MKKRNHVWVIEYESASGWLVKIGYPTREDARFMADLLPSANGVKYRITKYISTREVCP